MQVMLVKPVLDTSDSTNSWLEIMMMELGTKDRDLAFITPTCTLQALRGCIGIAAAGHLDAHLPLSLCGFPTPSDDTENAEQKIETLFRQVAETLPPSITLRPEDAVSATLQVLTEGIQPEEIQALLWMLPEKIREIWPVNAICKKAH